MPEALSVNPEPYRHSWRQGAPYEEVFTGWSYPPTDYDKWEELVYQWTKHCVERYGAEEVEQWWWETWNEPNIPYWQGTREEFLRLNDHALAGVLRALPTARVGGPDVAGDGGDFTRAFIEHALTGENDADGEVGHKLDFVSFHAKGAPTTENGFVRMGISAQLKTIDKGFRIIASYPETKNLPIVIGESDPEGCAACQGDNLQYRNGVMYAAYTAASFAREHDLARRHDVHLAGALTWAFTFEDQPYFAGFRALATNGIDKPVLNVFRMFARMTGERIEARSDHEVALDDIVENGVRGAPDVGALASRTEDGASVMVWHYHDDMIPGPDADVRLTLTGAPVGARTAHVRHFRIDGDHSNAYAAWLKMGSPQEPSPEQYAALEAAGQLQELEPPHDIDLVDGAGELDFLLPRLGVSLIEIDWR